MSERAQALEAALRKLRNECHALKAMSYDAIKASAGYTNLKFWMDRIDEADALLEAPPVGVSPQPDAEMWERRARVTLWLNHGCTGLYGDDGEMQCSNVKAHPGVYDFKRTPWEDIQAAFALSEAVQQALASLAPVEPTPPAEDEDDDEVPVACAEGAPDAWSAPLRKPVVPKILSTDDFYALLRILEALPADPFLSALQVKLSDEKRRQYGNQASHLSGSEFVREVKRVEALIQGSGPVRDCSRCGRVEPTPEPTPDAQVCAWREIGHGPIRRAGCRDMWETSGHMVGWQCCPYCTKPLVVGTAPQGGEQ